ncbi:MAG: DMT family transporter [Clostridiales Family XIII bacterium]|nr:DMT family transporter [Clostridiales Family XIII bacterium]
MSQKSRKFAYAMMIFVVIAWGFDYVAAKFVLEAIAPLPLVCIKYGIGCIVLLAIKTVRDRRFVFRVKDLPLLIACALFGEVFYYACEYGAMAYLPVSIISIVLAFVPVVSVILERFIWKRAANPKIWVGIAISIFGVALVIGGDFSALFSGSMIGYLLVFGAVFSWNIYNFCTAGLTKRYRPLDLTLYQTLCTTLLALPFLLHNLPPATAFTGVPLAMVLYLGIVSEGIGFMIYVNAIDKLGPTPCALFSNMLPVSSAFFGWMLLGERIVPLQIAGGAVVVAAGIMVIWEKGKLDEKRLHDARVSG